MENTRGQKNTQENKSRNQQSQQYGSKGSRENTSSQTDRNSSRDEQDVSGSRRSSTSRNSGLSSKTGVTGSDSDGQLSE